MKGVWHLIAADLDADEKLAELGVERPWTPIEWALFDRWRSVWAAAA